MSTCVRLPQADGSMRYLVHHRETWYRTPVQITLAREGAPREAEHFALIVGSKSSDGDLRYTKITLTQDEMQFLFKGYLEILREIEERP
jgi:hypothetical protein